MTDFEKLANDGSLLSEEGAAMIRNYLLGGLALGGSGALATSLINYLNHIRKPVYTSADDDDTIYVYKRKDNKGKLNKKASDDNVASGMGERGLAMAGAVGGTFAGYMLVKKLYAKLRAAQAQQELDEAQRVFLDEQGYNVAKKASYEKAAAPGNAPLSTWDATTGGIMAVPVLLALATGVATHMMLDNKYPVKPVSEVKGPKKIKIIDSPEHESKDQDEYLKLASHEVEDEAKELIIRAALLNPVENSDLLDVCCACANGRHEELKKAAQAIGFLPALSLVKGASAHEPSQLSKHIAIGWMSKDAYMNKSIALMAAGEFAEQYPTFYKQACILPRDIQENLFKAAVCLNRAIRFQQSQELGISFPDNGMTEKQAAAGAGTGDYLSRLLTRLNQTPSLRNAEPVTEGDDKESTETSGAMAGIHNPDSPSRPTHAKKMSFISSSKTARRNANDLPTDAIDQFLAGTPAPNAQPNLPTAGMQ